MNEGRHCIFCCINPSGNIPSLIELIGIGGTDIYVSTHSRIRIVCTIGADVTVGSEYELSHRASDGVEGQIGLFDAAEDTAIKNYEFPDLAELPIEQRLAQEKESTGFYFSGHPLDRYRADIQARGALTVSALRSLALDGEGGENVERSEYTIGGMVSSVSEKRTKKGDMMAFVTLEDESLPIELIVFPRVYEQCRPYLTAGSPIAVRGRPQLGDDDEKRTVSLIASAIEPLRAGAVTSSGASGAAPQAVSASSSAAHRAASNRLMGFLLKFHQQK